MPSTPPLPRPRGTCRELRRARLPRIPLTVEDMVLHQHYGAVTVETEEESPSTSFAHQPQLQRSTSVGEQGLDNIASSLDETPSSFDEFPSPAVVLEADELTEESKLIYAYNLAINYGLSAPTLETLNDLLRLWTGGEHYKNICTSLRSEVQRMLEKYRYNIHYYCRRCDAFLPSRFSVCTTSSCPLQNVKCKRSKEMKRTSVHTVAIRPQLETVLRSVLDDLIAAHQAHHAGQPCPSKSETFHFAAYTGDIESNDAFLRGDIHVILTMNFDGVTFKKLSRAEAWPLYLRLEGLSVKKKIGSTTSSSEERC